MVQAHARELLNQKESGDTTMAKTDHPLYAASDRLVAALDRLESNLERLKAAPEANGKESAQIRAFERENKTLKSEHEKLNTAIAQLQGEYDDLHQVASTIYSKLEDSIRRLTQIIEN